VVDETVAGLKRSSRSSANRSVSWRSSQASMAVDSLSPGSIIENPSLILASGSDCLRALYGQKQQRLLKQQAHEAHDDPQEAELKQVLDETTQEL